MKQEEFPLPHLCFYMIYFDKVNKSFADKTFAIRDISMNIDKGEFVSIVGPSGAGKTTVLRMLLAEEKPTAGKISYGSVDIHSIPRKELPKYRRKIGMVFQEFRLLPQRTAYENIAFAMEAAGRSDEEIEQDVPQALEIVGLQKKIHHFPHELSGGEKQRVAIARAIINQPEVLIADEPTGNLDPVNTKDIVEILLKVHKLGTTVILTTHNKSIIDSLGRRVIAMEDGRIVRDDEKGKYSA